MALGLAMRRAAFAGILCILSTSVLPSAEASAGWQRVPPMAYARAGHAATTLDDGSALVIGGGDGPTVTASVERFRPTIGTFKTIAPLNTGRRKHTADALADGSVLVAGGYGPGGVILASVELYDGREWTSMPSMAVARTLHASVRLADGRVMVLGGIGPSGVLSSVEIFDPTSRTWNAGAPLPSGRSNTTATVLSDGRVLVAGGAPSMLEVASRNAFLYQPLSNTWTLAGAMASPRSTHASARLAGGQVLVAGGWVVGAWPPIAGPHTFAVATASSEVYDPATDTWTYVGNMSVPRTNHTVSALPDGSVLASGGIGDDGGVGDTSAVAAELFDAGTMRWTEAGSMSTTRFNHAASVLRDGCVLVTGGFPTALDGPQDSADLYCGPVVAHGPRHRRAMTTNSTPCYSTTRSPVCTR